MGASTPCGDIMPRYCMVEDANGCILPRGHEGEHLSSTDEGLLEWETDMDCGCEHCMQCEGDYCVVFGPVVPASPEDVAALKPADLEVTQWPPAPTTGMHVGMAHGVWMKHRPSGVTVICERERSQHRNRDAALFVVATALKTIQRRQEAN